MKPLLSSGFRLSGVRTRHVSGKLCFEGVDEPSGAAIKHSAVKSLHFCICTIIVIRLKLLHALPAQAPLFFIARSACRATLSVPRASGGNDEVKVESLQSLSKQEQNEKNLDKVLISWRSRRELEEEDDSEDEGMEGEGEWVWWCAKEEKEKQRGQGVPLPMHPKEQDQISEWTKSKAGGQESKTGSQRDAMEGQPSTLNSKL
jgi:hypothetical protein